MIRILLADNHTLFQESFIDQLERYHHFSVVGSSTDGDITIKKALSLTPNILLTDVTLPGVDILNTITRLHQQLPNLKIVILTRLDDASLADTLMNAGASGYLLKSWPMSKISDTLIHITKGEYLDTPFGSASAEKSDDRKETNTYPSRLSARETEILRLIAAGQSNKSIAGSLKISIRTVETHRFRMKKKLGVKSIIECVQFALKNNIA
ncbi:LuxR C-terminal-related transcriptional regulator [Veronia pacifica]|uniref:DNA-binding response regulator n=1 Tax=Veronia pacifica TaxID=1080227 RepID=A0A1C3ED09_9GAMM|nr:response regulator transcription factor [Veronia pacifica]ODA31105.1 hypothetical protein A8L45_18185 [Veronia pacifica]